MTTNDLPAARRLVIGLALPLLVAVSLLTAACGARPSAGGPDTTSPSGEPTVAQETTAAAKLDDDDAVVFLSQHESVNDYPSGLDSGVISVDAEGCVRMQSRVPGGPPFAPVWPHDYSLDAGGDGPARILDGRGRTLARIGDEVRVGGGPISSPEEVADADERRLREIRERCPGAYFLVSEVLSARRG